MDFKVGGHKYYPMYFKVGGYKYYSIFLSMTRMVLFIILYKRTEGPGYRWPGFKGQHVL
jgi:hypothetical protein